jgi:hypothetical protein
MQIEWMDGGELGTGGIYTINDVAPSTGAVAAGFSGTYYYAVPGNNGYSNDINITARDEYYIGFRFKINAYGYICRLYSGTSQLLNIRLNSDGNIDIGLIDGYGGWHTLSACSSFYFYTARIYRVEMHFIRNTWSGSTANLNGTWAMKVNGLLVQNDTACQTTYYNMQYDQLRIGYQAGYDDLVISIDDWPGNLRLQGIYPDSTGSSTQWYNDTTGAEANYTRVGEIPYRDTDYVWVNTLDQVDLYGMSALSEGTNPINTIAGVQVWTRGSLAGLATPKDLQIALKSGSTTAYGTQHQMLDDQLYYWYTDVWTVNPDTTSAFSKAEINSIEIGLKSKARP